MSNPTHPSKERFGSEDLPQVNMKDALREVLKNHLLDDTRVTLYGEDIEDPKGDVFGVTKGLSTRFPGRVMNSPLSESTIVGAAIGRAMVGERPVAFFQYADFVPTAYNQIVNDDLDYDDLDHHNYSLYHLTVIYKKCKPASKKRILDQKRA